MFVVGNHSKITVNTRNVFIECTGTDFTKVSKPFFFFFLVLSDRTDFTSGPRLCDQTLKYLFQRWECILEI